MNKGRKVSSGKYVAERKKKRFEVAGQKRVIKLGEKDKRKNLRGRGGNEKVVLLSAKTVNVLGKDNKTKKMTIKNVLETPADRFLARQNIITKGTIVDTEAGKVRITNRPTQEGVLNGVLIE